MKSKNSNLSFEIIFIDKKRKYRLLKELSYFSTRYKKWITVQKGFVSDGATGAPDITTIAWFVHDWLCIQKRFDDGTRCTRWQGSCILSDCLWQDGYKIRAYLWFLPTLLAGLL